MEADLRQLVATVQNGHLRELLDAVFGPGVRHVGGFRDAPAAKRYHQAYRHGLLEHCVGVAQAVSAISATFPGIDRDVAVCGALLHDIGKLDAYTADPLGIEMTDAGKLQGEIALGYYRVRRLIEDLPGFPADLAAAVLHIILSHHGQLAHGSPVVPCTREATLVHMIDNLGGRLGSFDRLEKELRGRQPLVGLRPRAGRRRVLRGRAPPEARAWRLLARELRRGAVQQLADLVRGRDDPLRVVAPVLVAHRAVAGEDLGEAGDDRQRRAQVVAQLARRGGLALAHGVATSASSGGEM